MIDDLISRQAAIDEVVAWLKDRMSDKKNGKPLTERLKALPSAEPDLESAYMHGYTEAEAHFHKIRANKPAIIRCKDCKYFERYTDDGTFESALKMHQWDGECSEWVGHTYMGWFCSRAERRQYESD